VPPRETREIWPPGVRRIRRKVRCGNDEFLERIQRHHVVKAAGGGICGEAPTPFDCNEPRWRGDIGAHAIYGEIVSYRFRCPLDDELSGAAGRRHGSKPGLRVISLKLRPFNGIFSMTCARSRSDGCILGVHSVELATTETLSDDEPISILIFTETVSPHGARGRSRCAP